MTLIWKHTFEVHAGKPLDARAICRAHLDLLLHGLMKRTDRPDKNSAPSSLSSNLSTSLSTNQFRSLS
jgi:hypothetical protein